MFSHSSIRERTPSIRSWQCLYDRDLSTLKAIINRDNVYKQVDVDSKKAGNSKKSRNIAFDVGCSMGAFSTVHGAVWLGWKEGVRYLLSCKPDPYWCTDRGQSLRDVAYTCATQPGGEEIERMVEKYTKRWEKAQQTPEPQARAPQRSRRRRSTRPVDHQPPKAYPPPSLFGSAARDREMSMSYYGQRPYGFGRDRYHVTDMRDAYRPRSPPADACSKPTHTVPTPASAYPGSPTNTTSSKYKPKPASNTGTSAATSTSTSTSTSPAAYAVSDAQVLRSSDLGFVSSPMRPLPPFRGIRQLDLWGLEAAVSGVETELDLGAFVDQGLKWGRKLQKAKHTKHNPAQLSADEVAAIYLYTTESLLYRTLNAVMRSEDRSKAKLYFPYLRLLLNALDRIALCTAVAKPGVVWRGVRLREQQLQEQKTCAADIIEELKEKMEDEDELVWWAPSSCTTDMQTSIDFTGGSDCTNVRIMFAVSTKRGVPIVDYSAIPGEAEVLQPPGSMFMVKNVASPAPKLWIVQLEEVIPKRDLVA